MRYFVIGDDGQKYGPADIATLQSWIGEGRLLPTQQVEEEGSGIRMAASAVNGLNFPNVAPQQPAQGAAPYQEAPSAVPTGSPYNRPVGAQVMSGDDGSQDVTLAWVFGVLGLLVCCVCDFVGLYFANRALSKGNPNANGPRVFSIVVICIQVVGGLLYLVLVAMAVKNGIHTAQPPVFRPN